MKNLLVFITLILSNFNSSSQVDSVWQAYNDSSDVYYNAKDYQTAIDWLNKGKLHLISTHKEFNLDSTYNLAISYMGLCYKKLGEYSKSLNLYFEALENIGISLGKQHSDYAALLNNIALVYKTAGRYEEALPYYREALENVENNLGKQDSEYLIKLNNLAILYKDMGQYEQALPLYLEALENSGINQGKRHGSYGVKLNNLAVFYQSIGRYDEALPLYLEALENTRNSLGKGHSKYGSRLSNLAILYKEMGRYSEALPLSLDALENAEENFGTAHSTYGRRLNNLAVLYNSMGNYQEALPLYLQAIKTTEKSLGKQHLQYGNRLSNLASLYKEMSRYDEAIPLFRKSLENAENNLGIHHIEYGKRLINLARLYQSIGSYKEALPLYMKANENFTKQFEQVFNISSEKNKMDFLSTLTNYFQVQQSFGYASQYQFDTLNMLLYNNELLHKELVLNSTKRTLEVLRESKDTSLVMQFNKWNNIRNQLARQYAQPISKRLNNLDSLKQVANTMEQDLVVKSEFFAKAVRNVDWEDVRSSLRKGEMAIEFVRFPHHKGDSIDVNLYIAMLLTQESIYPEVVILFEEKELDDLLIKEEGKSDRYFFSKLYSYKEKNNALYRLIWSKLDPLLEDIHTVYLVPSGLLHQISFQAIPHQKGGFLFDYYKIVRLNSTSQLVLEKQNLDYSTITLYGGIDYEYVINELDNTASKESASVNLFPENRSSHIKSFNFLPGTLKEVELIQKVFSEHIGNIEIRSGKSASEFGFKALSGNSQKILHIATHGFFSPNIEPLSTNNNQGAAFKNLENPLLRAGLIFTGGNFAWKHGHNPNEEEDGIVTAYEISNLDLSNTGLVVLSACETGLGEIKGNEGVFGLQRAFKMAGVDNLIMSLWQVNDKQTSELMESFYRVTHLDRKI